MCIRDSYAESPKAATDYFYKLSQDCNYIRRDRIAKDEHWTTETKYGELDVYKRQRLGNLPSGI